MLLIFIDSLIVTFSVFGLFNFRTVFESYSIRILIISAISLLIFHHLFAAIFNLYHRAWEYASVSELLLVVQSVTCSILATIVVVPLITWQAPFLRLYFITWMMHIILIGDQEYFGEFIENM